MIKTLLIVILLPMCLLSNGQTTIYDRNGKRSSFAAEDLDIFFTRDITTSVVKFPSVTGTELAPVLAALLPTAVDVGLKALGSALERRVKKFSAEHSKHKSNLLAGNKEVPQFDFVRKVSFGNGSESEDAFAIRFGAKLVPGVEGFVIYIKSITRNYSSAKVTKSNSSLDYTIDIKITLLVNGEKKLQEISPIVISSVPFGETKFSVDDNTDPKHRSDMIALPKGGLLSEVSIKVVESNPEKVRAERILAIWNEQKDNVKTVVNYFLPKEKEAAGGGDDKADADSNKPVGNQN